ncbi:MAG: hypothetical protein HRT71_10495 [Flavobacteriales bacterium]|nr:hypothetical protein [Flavobacteriales bacterium]
MSPLFDTLSLMTFGLGISMLTELNANAYIVLQITVFLFAFSPALLKYQGMPRAFHGSPRLFGQFLYIGHIIGYLVYIQSENYWALGISILLGALVWVSAKFAIQVMIFFGAIFLFAFNQYYYAFVGSIFLSIIISGGRVITLIKGQINHSTYLLKKLDISPKINGFMVFKNHVLEMIKAFVKLEFKKSAKIFFKENYLPFTLLVQFPFFLVVLDYTLFSLFPYLYIWTVAGLACFVLTTIKPLKFLGENIRYLEFSVLPAIYLSTIVIMDQEMLWLIIAYGAFSLFASIYYVRTFISDHQKANELHLNRKALFDTMNSMENGNVLAMCSTGHPALLLGNYPVLSLLIAEIDMNVFPENEFDLLGSNFSYPSGRFEEILKKYNISYVTLTESEEEIYLERYINDKEQFSNNLELVTQIDILKLYKVKLKG